jgi:hypothetical protein
VQRVRMYEILAATVALVLLLATGSAHGGVSAPPTAPEERQPTHGVVVAELAQEHAVARAGTGTQSAAGKFLAVAPPTDASGSGTVRATAPQAVAGEVGFAVPLGRSVRAPPRAAAV